MEVPGTRQVGEIKVFVRHFKHCSRIGEDVPGASMRQYDRKSRVRRAPWAHNRFQIHATLPQARQRQLPQWVAAHTRHESDSSAHHREVVCADRRRAAQRQHIAFGEQFTFNRKFFRCAVQDQIKINLAG